MSGPGFCDYCDNRGVVGGRMPDGVYTARPCKHCDLNEGNPVITFEKMSSPMQGSVIEPELYSADKHETWTCWLEPELPGVRLVAVIDPMYRTHLWSGEGLAVKGSWPMVKLESELARLAMDLRWIGDKEWAAGAALELTYVPGADQRLVQAHVCHTMPFTALLSGRDTTPLGQRRSALHEAFAESEYSFLQLVPHKRVATRPSLDQELLDNACQEWGVSSLLIKQTFGKWGQPGCWLRYVEDF